MTLGKFKPIMSRFVQLRPCGDRLDHLRRIRPGYAKLGQVKRGYTIFILVRPGQVISRHISLWQDRFG